MDEALSFERGCASIQYAHARACKLLEKVSEFNPSKVDMDSLDFQNMDTLEIDLLKTLARFSTIIEDSARDLRFILWPSTPLKWQEHLTSSINQCP